MSKPITYLTMISILLVAISCNQSKQKDGVQNMPDRKINHNNQINIIEEDTLELAPIEPPMAKKEQVYDEEITLGLFEEFQDLPELKLKPIDKNTYEKYQATYHNPLTIESGSFHVNQTDSILTFSTRKANFSYPIDDGRYKMGSNYVQYIGTIPSLNLALFEHWGVGDFTIGTAFWVDWITNTRYNVEVDADGAAAAPVVSPGSKYIVAFNKIYLSSTNYIRIFRIIPEDGSFKYEPAGNISLENQVVYEAIWANDNRLLLCIDNSDQAEEIHTPEEREKLRSKYLTYTEVELPRINK